MKLDWETVIGSLAKHKQLDKDTYELTPYEANIMANAFTPYDLMMRPTNLPLKSGPLPETAFNMQNVGRVGVENATVIYPDEVLSLENIMGILAHEKAHARQLPIDKPNQGYTTFAGRPGNAGIAEKSAMAAEDSNKAVQNLLWLEKARKWLSET